MTTQQILDDPYLSRIANGRGYDWVFALACLVVPIAICFAPYMQ